MRTEPPDDPLLGRVLAGAYRLEAVLGRGAMGVVYRARHTVLDQDFAVKVLTPEVASEERVRNRLLQEAQTLALLSHRNIVAVRHCGEEDGLLYVVMDYCEGEPLRALLTREGALSPERTTGILVQVLAALGEAHARGIVHRDLKPDNVMVGPSLDAESDEVHVSVLDFGLARVLEEARVRMPGAMVSTDQQIVGTVAYMSPEQIRASKELDGRSDLFSLGVVAFEMLAGQLPFHSDDSLSVMMRILESPPPPLPANGPEGVPRELRSVVVRALMKDPDDRFQSAPDFAAALRGELDPRDAPARAAASAKAAPSGATTAAPGLVVRRPHWALLAGIVLAGVAWWWFTRYDEEAVRESGHAAMRSCGWKRAATTFADLADRGRAAGADYLALAQARIALRDPRAREALEDAAGALGRHDAGLLLERARFAWLVEHDAAAALETLAEAAAAEGAGVAPLLLRVEILLDPGPRTKGLMLPRSRQRMLEADVTALERLAPEDPRTRYVRGRIDAIAIAPLAFDEAKPRTDAVVATLTAAAEAESAWAAPLMHAANAWSVLASKARHEGRADEATAPLAEAQRLADASIERLLAHPHHACQMDDRPALLEIRALVRLNAGAYEAGIADVREVYAARKDLSTFRQLADRLRTSGHIDEAIQLYERLTAATQDRGAWFDLAFCWQMKGRTSASEASWGDAQEAYERAVDAHRAAIAAEGAGYIDHAYLGETWMLLAELPGADRDRVLEQAGAAFGRARELAPPKGSTELEYRRALYLCARGEVDAARNDLAAAMAQDATPTPAMRARMARILIASAAASWKDRDRAAGFLAQAEEQVAFATGMLNATSPGLASLRAQAAIVAAALAGTVEARHAALEEALPHARTAEAGAEGRSDWVREGLRLQRRMIELLSGGSASVHASALLTGRMLELGGGGLRPGPEHYDRLAALAEDRGDGATASAAAARAKTLRGL